jgi:multiple sugar transport system permease protein
MTSTSTLTTATGARGARPRRASWYTGLLGADFVWGAAFVLPYLAVFVLFVIYPVAYGLWLGADPKSYTALFADPIYIETLINTVIYLAIGVNVKLFLALLLSGFFMRPGRWVKGLLLVFILPWAVPAIPTFISWHWMLNGQWGLINNAIWNLFQVDGPPWLDTAHYAMGSVIVAYIWKWLPFWTIIFLAGRMAIPKELYEAASVDGATGLRSFAHVTFPLLANLYVVCTLLSTIWTLGDYNTVHFVSGGGPALQTHVLATLGIRNAFELGDPHMGMATVISALPLLIPLVIYLMRKLSTGEVHL